LVSLGFDKEQGSLLARSRKRRWAAFAYCSPHYRYPA